MADRLREAVSPYLRSHADNPVDWYPWGPEAFAAARTRDVPVLVSVGYATCHWCHVMARESFGDPALAAVLNGGFVAVKVDREEHPQVDTALLAAAGAFTPHLGWPLNVFLTPEGRAFHAGTYSPPEPRAGQPSFRQVLDAVTEAWTERRDDVERSAAGLAQALAEAGRAAEATSITAGDLALVVDELGRFEDRVHGGFGGAPKFPVAPALVTLLAVGRSPVVDAAHRDTADGIARRSLDAMRDGGLRDPVEGGFFRYAVRRDWSEPHYERMLVDNAMLLRAYAAAGDRPAAAGIVGFLRDVLRQPDGTFGSAQDSESTVDGARTEGGYYALDAAARAGQPRPAVDAKVLTGWNGLAIGALAHAGTLLGEPAWIDLAETAADALLAAHLLPDGRLLRASRDGRASAAVAVLEDHGALADGLLDVAIAAGRPDLAVAARRIVDRCRTPEGLRAPDGADPTAAALGLDAVEDIAEGAGPSGAAAVARAAERLYLLAGDIADRRAATDTIAPHLRGAVARPLGHGAILGVALAQLEPVRQVVVVLPDDHAGDGRLAAAARALPSCLTVVVDERTARRFAAAGFTLFEGRTAVRGAPTAYLCNDFVCRLPLGDPAELGWA